MMTPRLVRRRRMMPSHRADIMNTCGTSASRTARPSVTLTASHIRTSPRWTRSETWTPDSSAPCLSANQVSEQLKSFLFLNTPNSLKLMVWKDLKPACDFHFFFFLSNGSFHFKIQHHIQWVFMRSSGAFTEDGQRKFQAFVLLFTVFDETKSWYGQVGEKMSREKFRRSDGRKEYHTINGYVNSTLPGKQIQSLLS